jgi:hypothetical protein
MGPNVKYLFCNTYLQQSQPHPPGQPHDRLSITVASETLHDQLQMSLSSCKMCYILLRIQ